jgi:hypothetical protein
MPALQPKIPVLFGGGNLKSCTALPAAMPSQPKKNTNGPRSRPERGKRRRNTGFTATNAAKRKMPMCLPQPLGRVADRLLCDVPNFIFNFFNYFYFIIL